MHTQQYDAVCINIIAILFTAAAVTGCSSTAFGDLSCRPSIWRQLADLSEDKLLVFRHRLPELVAQVHGEVDVPRVHSDAACGLPSVVAELIVTGVLKELSGTRQGGLVG